MVSKTREPTNLAANLMTSKPDCEAEASLLDEEQFQLVGGALQVPGGRKVDKGGYCLDRGRARLCKEHVELR